LSPVAGGGWTQTRFVTGLGASSAVAMTFGPAGGGQALYYTSYAGGGEVRRIAYTTNNRPPKAELSASPTAGPAPLNVTLDGSASSDPDGDDVTYQWTFGDGSGESTTASTTTHQYDYGSYTASLRLRDRHGALSDPATVAIDAGNTPPVPTIDTPLPAETFAVGQEISLRGHADDTQDGALPASGLRWEVLRHHDSHTHPEVTPTTGAQVDFPAPSPEDLTATTTSHLELRLTATDSSGRSATVSQELHPRLVDVAFTTQPSGLRLGVNERSLTGPSTVTSWQGFALSVSAATQTDSAGRRWAFNRWSDSGQASHQIITGGSAATYTATFTEIGNGLRGSYYDAQDFSALATTRTDATVNFDWKHGAPAAGMGADTFSVRWTGSVKTRYSERYTFTVASDEGARLWVDGQQIIDDFSPHTLRSRSGSITLTAGRRYPVRLDYYDRSGVAAAKLQWSSSRQARQVVPRSQLFPPS
jgi:PKD repeat protein